MTHNNPQLSCLYIRTYHSIFNSSINVKVLLLNIYCYTVRSKFTIKIQLWSIRLLVLVSLSLY